MYNGKPIFYGLGNLLFDKINGLNSNFNEGYMVNLSFKKDEIEYTQLFSE